VPAIELTAYGLGLRKLLVPGLPAGDGAGPVRHAAVGGVGPSSSTRTRAPAGDGPASRQTGEAAFTIVAVGPASRKSAPAASATDALCTTSSWPRSEQAKHHLVDPVLADDRRQFLLRQDGDAVRV
jgi:hypothetical protein